MSHYRDRAYCVRSGGDCTNATCDRYVSPKVEEMAAKSGLPIGYADLMTSKCGYQPKGETER